MTVTENDPGYRDAVMAKVIGAKAQEPQLEAASPAGWEHVATDSTGTTYRLVIPGGALYRHDYESPTGVVTSAVGWSVSTR